MEITLPNNEQTPRNLKFWTFLSQQNCPDFYHTIAPDFNRHPFIAYLSGTMEQSSYVHITVGA